MGSRYQRGYVRCVKRKCGSACWEFLWREDDVTGNECAGLQSLGRSSSFRPKRRLGQR